MARGEIGIDEHGGQESLAKALVAPRPVEEHHGLPEAIDCLTIVALGLVGEAEARGAPARAGRHLRQPWRARERAG